MTYATVNKSNPNSMTLQSIGNVLGTPAANIKQGDSLMWNFGFVEFVNAIVKETEKMIVVSITTKSGFIGERKLSKTRLVCILNN